MRTIKFPNMFNTNSTNVWKGSEHLKATTQSTLLLLKTERGELFGDPYFGVLLKRYLYDQNNYIVRDQLIDTIYTQLALFVPQVRVERRNIDVYADSKMARVYCKFSGINQIDYQPNTYNLLLFENSDF